MSPAILETEDQVNGHSPSPNLNLRILGVGTEYPPYQVGPDALETIAERFYPQSSSLSKVLTINRFTGIESRSAIGDVNHPLANQPKAPTIAQLCDLFLSEGVRLSVNACRKAIKEWGGDVKDITHVVSTTCTNSANPGYDHYVVKQLGIPQGVEKVLLHGIGCSGGLNALRTGANLACGASFAKKPARVLVLACEISSLLVRSELDSIVENDEVRIGAALFSDCASAVVLSNGIGEADRGKGVYELLGWKHDIIPDTERDLGFDVDPLGWKVVLSPRVPELAANSVAPVFKQLLADTPGFESNGKTHTAADFDWALHPGGLTVITGIQETMNVTEEHLRASYDIYMKHGNSSSATILSVMDRLRKMGPGRENVVACAFGPGIAVEMALLRRIPSIVDLPTEALD
ncbi:MAG: hypothetical protein M1817_004148 [Caeruleum heppii]|nr:MAG: hypothetical protein M1817_004148 [Caeruleum heppii]